MSATIREAVQQALKTILHDTIVVDTLTIPFYLSYFGASDYGIYLESYQYDDDSMKQYYGGTASIDLVIFGKDRTPDFVAEITRRVMLAIKASVNDTIQLASGWQATVTQLPNVRSFTEGDEAAVVHRDTLRVTIRVDENSNNNS